MKNAIYIGKGFKKDFGHEIWIEGAGTMKSSSLHYGRTGHAYYWREKRKWDFRPDGLNIQHLIHRNDLHFTDDDI